MELTWITIAASLLMGLGAAFLFIFAVKRGWFRDLEAAKFQVFWSDPDDPMPSKQESAHGSEPQKK